MLSHVHPYQRVGAGFQTASGPARHPPPAACLTSRRTSTYSCCATSSKSCKGRHIPPSLQRKRKGTRWRTFLGHYADRMVACDFSTAETVRLQTLFVLFFIELGTRRVHLAGCTAHPTSGWVTQQARNLTWEMEDLGNRERDIELPVRFLIHDWNANVTPSFNSVFAS